MPASAAGAASRYALPVLATAGGWRRPGDQLFEAHGLTPMARAGARRLPSRLIWRPLFALARLFRATGIPRLLAGKGRLRFGLGMLASTAEARSSGAAAAGRQKAEILGASLSSAAGRAACRPRRTVAIFRGCVMSTLFDHVHDATRRTLEVNGYRVIEAASGSGAGVCCGALHEHAGDIEGARALAATNVAALAEGADFIVVNSAGCGALLKDYGQLMGTPDSAVRSRQGPGRLRAAGRARSQAGLRRWTWRWYTTRPATSSTRRESRKRPSPF